MSRKIEYNGQSRSVREWADHLGINRATLAWRLHRYSSVEEAFTKPIDKALSIRGKEGAQIRYASKPYAQAELEVAKALTKPINSHNGYKPKNVVWKDAFDSIEEDKMYPVSILTRLTSGSTAHRARRDGQIPVHTYEGGVIRLKGFDIKQFILKKGLSIQERDKVISNMTPLPKRAYKRKEVPLFKELVVTDFKPRPVMPYVFMTLLGVLIGLILKGVCS